MLLVGECSYIKLQPNDLLVAVREVLLAKVVVHLQRQPKAGGA